MTPQRALAHGTVRPTGLGCMNVTHAYSSFPDRRDAVRLFREAIDAGVDHFDTAPLYGHGVSEELVGEALGGQRDDIFLASKCGLRRTEDGQTIACDWAEGFMEAVELRPRAWQAMLDSEEDRHLLAPIVGHLHEEDGDPIIQGDADDVGQLRGEATELIGPCGCTSFAGF